MTLLAALRRGRQIVARAIWDVASWIYPYASFDHDDEHERAWEMTAVFTGTEAEADKVFDRLTELSCLENDHHHMDPCRFVVGSFGPAKDDE